MRCNPEQCLKQLIMLWSTPAAAAEKGRAASSSGGDSEADSEAVGDVQQDSKGIAAEWCL